MITARTNKAKSSSGKAGDAKHANAKSKSAKLTAQKPQASKSNPKKAAPSKISAPKPVPSKKAPVVAKSAAKLGAKLSGKLGGHKGDGKGPAKNPASQHPKPAVSKSTSGKPVSGKLVSNKQVTSKSSSKAPAKKSQPLPPPKPRNPRIVERIQRANAERENRKDLSRVVTNGQVVFPPEGANGHNRPKPNGRPEFKGDRDRIVLMVRDAYWLHAYWEVTRPSIQRAQAAMAEQWHTARPVLRLMEVDAGATTSSAERLSREIFIHGGVTNWYIDVPNPPKSFRVDIGYVASNGKFYSLARSNVVSTPNPGTTDEVDPHWTDVAENFEKIYALSGGFSDDHATGDLQELFEERLRRPMKSATSEGFGVGAERALKRDRDFRFEIDAEMLVFGQTKPGGHVTVGGAPVKVKADGSFAVRLAMPDKRQVLPLVARSVDGVENRTIVLAVERNTKIMEPMIKESGE